MVFEKGDTAEVARYMERKNTVVLGFANSVPEAGASGSVSNLVQKKGCFYVMCPVNSTTMIDRLFIQAFLDSFHWCFLYRFFVAVPCRLMFYTVGICTFIGA